MQMRRRRYIRFDFTQALHTRATSAERGDYRIIARARASDLSSTKAFARSVGLGSNEARVRVRGIHPTIRTNAHGSRFAHIFSVPPRIATVVQRQFLALAELVSGPQESARSGIIGRSERIKSKRRASSSQSNFSWSSSSHFYRRDNAATDFSARNTPRSK
jgi:hypothetical protein